MREVDDIRQDAIFLGGQGLAGYRLGSRSVKEFGGGSSRASGPVVQVE